MATTLDNNLHTRPGAVEETADGEGRTRPDWYAHSDKDIAYAAVNALFLDIRVPESRIKLRVENRWITLVGDVDWPFQRNAAEHTLLQLAGVQGVTNLITVRARTYAYRPSDRVAIPD